MGTVTVHAWRGPLAGRRVEIDEADLDAATADDGWAQKLEPGTVLKNDPSAALDPKWKIPGIESPAAEVETTKPARGGKADDEDGEGEDGETTTTTRGRPRKPR